MNNFLGESSLRLSFGFSRAGRLYGCDTPKRLVSLSLSLSLSLSFCQLVTTKDGAGLVSCFFHLGTVSFAPDSVSLRCGVLPCDASAHSPRASNSEACFGCSGASSVRLAYCPVFCVVYLSIAFVNGGRTKWPFAADK